MYTRNSLFEERNLFYRKGDISSPISYVHPWVESPLQTLLVNIPESVEAVLVYSSALGDFMKLNSDLDLAVISKDRSCLSAKFIKSLNLDIEVDIKVFESIEELTEQANNWFPVPIDIVTHGLLVYMKNHSIELGDIS